MFREPSYRKRRCSSDIAGRLLARNRGGGPLTGFFKGRANTQQTIRDRKAVCLPERAELRAARRQERARAPPPAFPPTAMISSVRGSCRVLMKPISQAVGPKGGTMTAESA